MCQKQGTWSEYFYQPWNDQHTEFSYHNGSVFVKYIGPSDFDHVISYTYVELVCDENKAVGKLETTYES